MSEIRQWRDHGGGWHDYFRGDSVPQLATGTRVLYDSPPPSHAVLERLREAREKAKTSNVVTACIILEDAIDALLTETPEDPAVASPAADVARTRKALDIAGKAIALRSKIRQEIDTNEVITLLETSRAYLAATENMGAEIPRVPTYEVIGACIVPGGDHNTVTVKVPREVRIDHLRMGQRFPLALPEPCAECERLRTENGKAEQMFNDRGEIIDRLRAELAALRAEHEKDAVDAGNYRDVLSRFNIPNNGVGAHIIHIQSDLADLRTSASKLASERDEWMTKWRDLNATIVTSEEWEKRKVDLIKQADHEIAITAHEDVDDLRSITRQLTLALANCNVQGAHRLPSDLIEFCEYWTNPGTQGHLYDLCEWALRFNAPACECAKWKRLSRTCFACDTEFDTVAALKAHVLACEKHPPNVECAKLRGQLADAEAHNAQWEAEATKLRARLDASEAENKRAKAYMEAMALVGDKTVAMPRDAVKPWPKPWPLENEPWKIAVMRRVESLEAGTHPDMPLSCGCVCNDGQRIAACEEHEE